MPVEITKLANGLTVATDNMPDASSVAFGVWIGVGTRDETAQQHGLAHLVEHMLFKGTQKRSAFQIAAELENVGGYLNAYTSREETAYHARVLPQHVPLAMDIISDMVQAPSFPPDEMERERGVIIQEIGQYYDSPDDHVFDLLQRDVYPDHPMGRNILGTVKTIAEAPPSHLRDWLSAHYHANNMWLVASGRVDHAEFVKLAEKYFAGLKAGPVAARTTPSFRAKTQHAPRDLEQLHVALAWPGVGYAAPTYYATQVLMTVLAGGMSSRLFQEVREKRGLVYAVSMGNNPARDGGLIALYAGTGPDKYRELKETIAHELKRLETDLGADELARAKAQMVAGMTMAHDSINTRCEQLAYQLMIHGRAVPLAERVGKINTITAADVIAAAAPLREPASECTLGKIA